MVQLTGKYELVKSENFASHLISMGCPEDKAKAAEKLKPVYDVKHNGEIISIDMILDDVKHVDLVLNKEIDEESILGTIVKTTSVLEGDVLTLTSKLPNGRIEKRVHKFSDSDVIVICEDDDPSTPDAVRVFKRL